jgi:2-hydroxy-6-oxonona-2,4-dienedioate hydrolase
VKVLHASVLAILGVAVVSGVVVYALFDADMRAARSAIADRSKVAETALGLIEYADVGNENGPALLTIHGAGGGFDQGVQNAVSMIGGGYRMIAPSRFGYLRTPISADVSPAAQADAHAALLDELGVSEAVVLGVSAGTRSALELAIRHPDRVAALILVVPATYAPDIVPLESQREADFPLVLWLVNAGADFAWWMLEHVSPDTLISFIGIPPDVVRTAGPDDQAAVTAMIRSIQPLSARFAGINVDSQPDLTERPLGELRIPTLLITARDDLFNTLPPAEFAALHIPGAQLVVYERGGHLLVGHDDEVRREIADFLARHGLATK